jgi:hypothetical protein
VGGLEKEIGRDLCGAHAGGFLEEKRRGRKGKFSGECNPCSGHESQELAT